jgi:hypothetical protein
MFQAEKISRTATIKLNGGFEQVFPLFGPVREMDWAEGWDPHILVSNAENIERHMVFQTHSHLPGEEGRYTWTVSIYDPDQGLIEYTVFTESRLWWIRIECQQLSGKAICEAEITYTFVSLDDHGNELNKLALAGMFRHDLKDWELAINHFLQSGGRLHHP